MSSGAIFQEALRRLNRLELPREAASDLLVALEAGKPGPLDVLGPAAVDAGLGREARLSRSAAIFFSFCAGNLADDLIDGECDYFAEPLRVAPSAQFLLQNLAFATAASAEAEVPGGALSEAFAALARAAGPQHLEVRTREWTAPRFREVAEGIAGGQWAGYLMLLLAGTPLSGPAAEWGRDLGIAGHTAKDVRTNDPRFHSMPEGDRREVLGWASAACDRLARSGRGWLEMAAKGIAPTLAEGR